jgi:GNAT superfamily N-acetyltransferase
MENTGGDFVFKPAGLEDFERLAALRLVVMRPSLEAIGRFEPGRARAHFQRTFRPQHTRLVEVGGVLAGCVALGPARDGDWLLEHFYLATERQGTGLGGRVLSRLLDEADVAGATVWLTVLRESPAGAFYRRFGFVETHTEGVDVFHTRPPRGATGRPPGTAPGP